MGQCAEDAVRPIIRRLRRTILVSRRTASKPVANDERVAGAGLPRSDMANDDGAEQQLKRECKSRCGGNPPPQAALISVQLQHPTPLAGITLTLPRAELKTVCRSLRLD
jgi:hypothetical protein